MSAVAPRDPFDARLALDARDVLAAFNHAGVLDAADLHVAAALGALGGEARVDVLLAAALAVRAPRLGHVYVDLATVHETAAVEVEESEESESSGPLGQLPWPAATAWVARVAESPLVLAETDPERPTALPAGEGRPLRLTGSRLYLDRYWAEESQVSADLLAMAAEDPPGLDAARLAGELERLFPEAGERDDGQRRACETAVRRRLSVIAGGPGTGKTTTVARVAALLISQALAEGGRRPLIALAAPTGKAAARLLEAVHEAAPELPFESPVREALLDLRSSTLHRLLGRRTNTTSRFGHHRGQRLPHDVVIVDETSMVSLSLMARLTEALRPQARLVLVGDPAQLTSIEAGAVLGDIVGPAAGTVAGGRPGTPAPGEPSARTDGDRPATRGPRARVDGDRPDARPRGALARHVVVLNRGYRFEGAIADLAGAVRAGDGDAAVAVLRHGGVEVMWVPAEVGAEDQPDLLEPIRAMATEAFVQVMAAARERRASEALRALASFRLLCGHRRGPRGVSGWSARVQAWLAPELAGVPRDGLWYPGCPLLITRNDYELGLLNGDTGVIVTGPDGRLAAAFGRGAETVEHLPARLGAVQTLYAMTIHKSQGSQFTTAAVVLPERDSRLLTRELLYTAVTRAQKRLVLAGSEEAIRAAVARPVGRASGLAERLWRA